MVVVAIAVLALVCLVLWVALSPRRSELRSQKIAITCPHCGSRPVETAVKLGVIRGLILYARWGSTYAVGCRECVRSAIGRAAGANLVLGWWSFPWGIGTPFVVAQNLLQYVTPAPGCLSEALRLSGIDVDDVVIDQYGLTRERRRILWAVFSYAERLYEAGARSAQRSALELADSMTDGSLSADDALAAVTAAGNQNVWPSELDEETRHALAQIVLEFGTMDGLPNPDLRFEMIAIVVELGFSDAIVDEFVFGTRTTPTPATSDALTAAATLLGVHPSASLLELKAAYRSKMLRYHPDHAAANGIDPDEANAVSVQLNAAYELLVDAARTSYATG